MSGERARMDGASPGTVNNMYKNTGELVYPILDQLAMAMTRRKCDCCSSVSGNTTKLNILSPPDTTPKDATERKNTSNIFLNAWPCF